MKATGIVRRIDELGRVVIPKEIRRTLRIRENEPLEIFTEKDGTIIFKKYSPVGDIASYAEQCANALTKIGEFGALVCDKDSVIAVSGVPKKEYREKAVSTSLTSLMEKRKEYLPDENEELFVVENGGSLSFFAPVISDGDVVGCVVSLRNGKKTAPESEQKLVRAGAMFLGKQTEI